MGCLCCCCAFTPEEPRGAWYFVRADPNVTSWGSLHLDSSDSEGWAHMFCNREPPRCPFCAEYIYPAYRETHVQLCATAQEERKRSGSGFNDKTLGHHMAGICQDELVKPGEPTPPMEDLCVVCMERRKVCAFLPCGHAASCFTCSRQLQICPLCRGNIIGLCRIYTKGSMSPQEQLRCKHCGDIILPSFFEGHQEVCGIQMREKQRVKEAAQTLKTRTEGGEWEAALPLTSFSENAATPADCSAENFRCLECGIHAKPPQQHMVITAPCGHVVLCEGCAKQKTTCPLCCSPIRTRTVVYN